MKRLLLLLVLICSFNTVAQQDYTVEGKTYSLYTEIEGPLTLLWNTIDGQYRYFSKKGDEILELKNTKEGKSYLEEYKAILLNQTKDQALSTQKVNLTKGSLSKFYNTYNSFADPNYAPANVPVAITLRLAGFVGATNYPYIVNPDNTSLPQIGVDFEMIDEGKLRRHGIVFQLRQIIGSSDYDFNSTQISLNYRFKFVKTDAFDVFLNTKVADYAYVKQDIMVTDSSGEPLNIAASGGEFQVPFAFGIGADIALGNGFITLGMYDMVAINLDDNGEFPIDIVAGYKFNL